MKRATVSDDRDDGSVANYKKNGGAEIQGPRQARTTVTSASEVGCMANLGTGEPEIQVGEFAHIQAPLISLAVALYPSVGSTESNLVSPCVLDEPEKPALRRTVKGHPFTQSVLHFDNSQADREARMRQLATVFIEMYRASRPDVSEVLNQRVA